MSPRHDPTYSLPLLVSSTSFGIQSRFWQDAGRALWCAQSSFCTLQSALFPKSLSDDRKQSMFPEGLVKWMTFPLCAAVLTASAAATGTRARTAAAAPASRPLKSLRMGVILGPAARLGNGGRAWPSPAPSEEPRVLVV